MLASVNVTFSFVCGTLPPQGPFTHTLDSLHYLHSDPEAHPNPYQRALRVVVPILARYDDDHKFPMLGFGGRCSPLASSGWQQHKTPCVV